jgi:hypothetical protein
LGTKLDTLRRIIAYNKDLFDVLVEYNLPFIRMYIGSTRPFEVKLGPGRPVLLVTLVPLEGGNVRLIIMPSGMMKATSISEFPDVLLRQKLTRFFKELA